MQKLKKKVMKLCLLYTRDPGKHIVKKSRWESIYDGHKNYLQTYTQVHYGLLWTFAEKYHVMTLLTT